MSAASAAMVSDRHEVLIGVEELADLVQSDQPPVVLDVRWIISGAQRAEFVAGHVPGARFVDLETELSDPAVPPEEGGRHPLPSAEAMAAIVTAWGVGAATPIVAMDNFASVGAARLWWLLRYFGHTGVRVLDGGWAAWSASGHPMETGDGRTDRSALPQGVEPFVPVPGAMPTLGMDDIAAWLDGGVLLDARPGERFRGEVEPMDPVPGHIPGSISLPTFSLVDERGQFRSASEIVAALGAAGVALDARIATSCGSGVTAAHELLALSLAGIDGTLFPGSYSLWSRTPGRPIASGPD